MVNQRIVISAVLMLVCLATGNAEAFTLEITADEGPVGEKAMSPDGQKAGESAFTSDANGTFYTDDEAYSGGRALELNIKEGSKGFGSLGGIIDFPLCEHADGRRLVKGDEIWVRVRLKFPEGFEFNQNGRNKFLRLRTFHEEQGEKVHEGYNDLYLDDPATSVERSYSPFNFIFEGAQQWHHFPGTEDDFGKMIGQWATIEYYIRLDDKKKSEGGDPMVRVWLNGELMGQTAERNTLKRPDSFIDSLYFFTYWDNAGAHKTQTFYADDLVITSDTPGTRDAQGNPFIGTGSERRSFQPPRRGAQGPTR